jgi:hypothetical protein
VTDARITCGQRSPIVHAARLGGKLRRNLPCARQRQNEQGNEALLQETGH